MVGRKVAIGGAERALQLHRIPLRQRHQRLQPEHGESIVVWAPEISPSVPLISVVPFSTRLPRIRAEVLKLILYRSDAPKKRVPATGATKRLLAALKAP